MIHSDLPLVALSPGRDGIPFVRSLSDGLRACRRGFLLLTRWQLTFYLGGKQDTDGQMSDASQTTAFELPAVYFAPKGPVTHIIFTTCLQPLVTTATTCTDVSY